MEMNLKLLSHRVCCRWPEASVRSQVPRGPQFNSTELRQPILKFVWQMIHNRMGERFVWDNFQINIQILIQIWRNNKIRSSKSLPHFSWFQKMFKNCHFQLKPHFKSTIWLEKWQHLSRVEWEIRHPYLEFPKDRPKDCLIGYRMRDLESETINNKLLLDLNEQTFPHHRTKSGKPKLKFWENKLHSREWQTLRQIRYNQRVLAAWDNKIRIICTTINNRVISIRFHEPQIMWP